MKCVSLEIEAVPIFMFIQRPKRSRKLCVSRSFIHSFIHSSTHYQLIFHHRTIFSRTQNPAYATWAASRLNDSLRFPKSTCSPHNARDLIQQADNDSKLIQQFFLHNFLYLYFRVSLEIVFIALSRLSHLRFHSNTTANLHDYRLFP